MCRLKCWSEVKCLCCADRSQGVEYANDLAESCRQVRTYVANLETEMKERTTLIEMLEQSELYYDAQASEANTVAMVSVCVSHHTHLPHLVNCLLSVILHVILEAPCLYRCKAIAAAACTLVTNCFTKVLICFFWTWSRMTYWHRFWWILSHNINVLKRTCTPEAIWCTYLFYALK